LLIDSILYVSYNLFMPTGGGNTFNIGYRGLLVLILLALAISSFLAFVNGYPALGWFCFGVLGASICVWAFFSGHTDKAVIVIFCICAAIAITAYFCGVEPEWQRVTGRTESGTQQRQEIPPKYSDLVIGD
jgi:hypothetical protein